jgi:MFS family permease
MLDLSLFRNPFRRERGDGLVGADVRVFFYNSLFIQNILGYSAIETGATFLPMTVLIILVAPFAGRLSDRIGRAG